MTCRHPKSRQTVRTGCYFGCVAPAHECSSASHGGVTDTITCGVCGATKEENINGRHYETSGWRKAEAAA